MNAIHLAQLLSSRICHDFATPMSGLHFATEILGGDDRQESPEAMNIALRSAKKLMTLLKYYRSAVGAMDLGSGEGLIIKSKQLIQDIFLEKTMDIQWSENHEEILGLCASSDNFKVLLNIFLLAHGCVAKSADMDVMVVEVNKKTIGVAIELKGQGIKMDYKVLECINGGGKEEEINAHTIHAYFTKQLSEQLTIQIEVRDSTKGNITMAVLLPKVMI